jgi:UDP-N-acetylglucosamine transferase subunit ALG13
MWALLVLCHITFCEEIITMSGTMSISKLVYGFVKPELDPLLINLSVIFQHAGHGSLLERSPA